MFKKILSFFERNIQEKMMNITPDIYAHTFLSAIIFILFVCIFDNWCNTFISVLVSGLITIGVGLFKEFVIDLKLRHYKADPKDIISDIVGICLGIFIYFYQSIV